jgi:transcriptional regulator with XRE-family HTH domain
MGYGEMLRSKRIEREMTLRDLSSRTDIDVAYISRVERETINPPQDEELLEAINGALNLPGQQSQEMKDQAAVDNRRFPADVARNMAKTAGFPLFLRTVSNKNLTPEKLKELSDFINERY